LLYLHALIISFLEKLEYIRAEILKNETRMKQIFLMFAAAAALTLTSCNDDDGGGGSGGPSTPTGAITADRNYFAGGAADQVQSEWSLPLVSATRIQGIITITGADQASGENIAISIPDNGVGLYQNTGQNAGDGVVLYTIQTGDNSFGSIGNGDPFNGYCIVEITEIDTAAKTLSGTFSAALTEGFSPGAFVIFENGEFNDVPYTTQVTGGGGLGEGDVSFNLDGEPFVTQTVTSFSNSFAGINFINIGAFNSNQDALSINIPTATTSGTTLEYGGLAQDQFAGFTFANGTYLTATAGSVTVTTHDVTNKFVEGTFNFELGQFLSPPTNSITNGTFAVTYQ
jgi:hypothetical protein